ncbi:MAG TPA: hypothetical protein VIC26_12440 [Marinagarivorans sp.]
MASSIDFVNKVFVIKMVGELSIRDINDANAQIYRDENFDVQIGQIWDLSAASLAQINERDMLIPVANDLGAAYSHSDVGVALVVQAPHDVAICQAYIEMSQKHESPWRFKICGSVDEAEMWVRRAR